MPSIEVNQLQKTFQTKRKAAGLRGSVRALIRPEYSTVEAVRNLSFQMEAGELLGFIGPNGAGKSTTIKILTGILHPTGGEAKVLGFVPWKELPFPMDEPLAIQCASGNRSMVAISVLKRRGIHNVIQVDGGIHKWKMQGFEVVSDHSNLITL